MSAYFEKNGFQFFKSIDYGEFIIYDIDNPKECNKYIKKYKIGNVWLNNPSIKFDSINFENRITSLMVSGVDFEKLPIFDNVKTLVGMSSNLVGNITAEKFPMLEYLSIDYKNCKQGLSDFKNLQSLKLRDFVKSKNGFLNFKLSPSIKHLDIIVSDIDNLLGLEQYNLELFYLFGCAFIVHLIFL